MKIALHKRSPSQSAFTLVEVLIVIGLITLVSTLVVINANAMLRGLGDDSVDQTMRQAVREARFQAGSLKSTVEMRYDADKAEFILINEFGQTLRTFPTRFSSEPKELDVEFSQRLPGFGLDVETRPKTVETDVVYFRPDRSSTPFEAKISFGRESFTMEFDPFSDIVLKDSRAQ